MREVVFESRACGACGADVPGGRGDVYVYAERRGGVFLSKLEETVWRSVTRERSGLAYAAGYAGLLSLFRYSFAPLTLSGWWPAWTLGTGLTLAFSLLAPLALLLSFGAAVSLDRSASKSGRLPALVGFAAGWQGSYALLFLLDELWQWLAAAS